MTSRPFGAMWTIWTLLPRRWSPDINNGGNQRLPESHVSEANVQQSYVWEVNVWKSNMSYVIYIISRAARAFILYAITPLASTGHEYHNIYRYPNQQFPFTRTDAYIGLHWHVHKMSTNYTHKSCVFAYNPFLCRITKTHSDKSIYSIYNYMCVK